MLAHEFGHVLDNRLGDDPSAYLRQVRPTPRGTDEIEWVIGQHTGLQVRMWSLKNYFELWADAFASWVFEEYSRDDDELTSEGSDWKRDLES